MSPRSHPDFWLSQEGTEQKTPPSGDTPRRPAPDGAATGAPASAGPEQRPIPSGTTLPTPEASPGWAPALGSKVSGAASGLSSKLPQAASGLLDAAKSEPGQQVLKAGTGAAGRAIKAYTGPAAAPKDPNKDILSLQTGRAALKRGLTKGVGDGAIGLVQGGVHGAALGAAKGAVVGAAEAVNAAADAKKQAKKGAAPGAAGGKPAPGTANVQSNRNGLIAQMGDSALSHGHRKLTSQLAQQGGKVGTAAKAGAIPTFQEAMAVQKAARTLAVEGTKKAAKVAVMGVGVMLALVIGAVATFTGISSAPVIGTFITSTLTNVSCTSASSPSPSAAAAGAGGAAGVGGALTADQTNNAKAIIGVAKTISFDQSGAIIGIMTALDESGLVNLDHGDRDSLGLFQQRPSTGWGTKDQIMNPAYAAQAFFLGVGGNSNPGLSSVPNWKTLDPWVAAQSVQRSGTSDGSNYHAKYAQAQSVVASLWDSSPAVPLVTGASTVNTSPGAANGNAADGSKNTATSTDGCASSVNPAASINSGDDYPARNEPYGRSAADYAAQCADSVAGGCRGECVDWASWTLVRSTGAYGSYQVAALGNAEDWGSAAKAHGIAVDMNPVAGDVVYFLPGMGGAGGVGHVATVKKVNGSRVDIEEYNFGGDTPATGGGRYHTRTINVGDASGYIHFLDPGKSPEDNKTSLITKGILVAGHGNWPRPAGA